MPEALLAHTSNMLAKTTERRRITLRCTQNAMLSSDTIAMLASSRLIIEQRLIRRVGVVRPMSDSDDMTGLSYMGWAQDFCTVESSPRMDLLRSPILKFAIRYLCTSSHATQSCKN